MPDAPAYAILGNGRWAARMRSILAAEDRRVKVISGSRQRPDESVAAYRSRLAKEFLASGAQIAWLCVLPGPHVAVMIEAALDAGVHIVVEKPWLCTPAVTQSLRSRATSAGRLIAIHYEYCLLDSVEKWRTDFYPGSGFRFGGHFFLNRPDHTGMHPMDNLGSHLLSICAYAVPQSALQEIRCGYKEPDERCVWLERRNVRAAFINLLENKEPIIQRFIGKFESGMDGADVPFGLDFALRVADDVAALT